MNHIRGVSGKLRIAVLLGLLLVAPATIAADPDSDPSWFDVIQTWFETLLNGDPEPTDPDEGTIRIPGG